MINASTFQASDEAGHGTVELTLGKVTRRVRAYRAAGMLTAYGVAGRYRTGGKVWPGMVTLYEAQGRESVFFGRDDRDPKFNKANALFFTE